jgi:acetyl esterase/lipase
MVRYGEHPDQWMQRWVPAAAPAGSVVLLHGGYWRHRYGLDLMEPLAGHLVGQGWQVWNVEYRRIEESDAGSDGDPWRRMSADILAALVVIGASLVVEDGPAVEDGPVVVVGHSAGGHLALWAAAASSVPTAVVALAPVTDLDEADRRDLSDGAVRELLASDRITAPDRYAEASPIRRVPLGVPQLIVHGPDDEHVPFALASSYAEAARLAGDVVELHDPPGVDHFDVIDPTHAVWATIDAWLLAATR